MNRFLRSAAISRIFRSLTVAVIPAIVLGAFSLTPVFAADSSGHSSAGAVLSARTREIFDAVRNEPQTVDPPVSIEIGLSEAVLMVLENNKDFKVQRFKPRISATAEESAVVKFDATRTAGMTLSRTSRPLVPAGSTATDAATAQYGFSKLNPSGTRVQSTLSFSQSRTSGSTGSNTADIDLRLIAPLRQGKGAKVNLATLEQARLDTRISRFELRGYAEQLVAQTEIAYWDCLYARRQIEIFTDSLALAQRELRETREKIDVGQIANTELAAVQAEVALREEGLINARSSLETALLRLRKLLSLRVTDPWNVKIEVIDILQAVDKPSPEDVSTVEEHVGTAMAMRPEIRQSLLAIEKDELEIVRTKNGLLPKLDLFIGLGRTGYADSFGRSFEEIGGDGYDLSSGITWELPTANRAARAAYDRALLSRERSDEAIENLRQIINVDVRSACIEVQRARNQITASAATSRSQEVKLRAETEKYRVGLSTSFMVAQAQRDALAGRLGEVQGRVNYRKALVNLYKADGTLLVRRGISIQGIPEPEAWKK